MRIGELSRRSGVAIETIRYYERARLLPPPARTTGGYRSYTPVALERLHFIKLTQGLGFALKEIRDLLRLHAAMAALPAEVWAGSAELRSVLELARRKHREIEQKISALRCLSGQLGAFIAGLEDPAPVCPASGAGARP
jgi:DNA-binding transcriptional MerR regulator